MEFLHAALAMLASMVFVLAGMVGYIYWQQTRMFHNVNTLSMVLGDLAQTLVASRGTPANVTLASTESGTETVQEADIPTSDEEDDRAEAEPETAPETAPEVPAVVRGPPEPLDTDGLQDKTKKELHDILTKRGIPFGKNDSKGVLISLLKASA